MDPAPRTYHFGPFRLDSEARALLRDAEPLALSQRALTLLRLLVEQPGQLVPKDRLIEAAWDGLAVEESNLTVQIAALRRVLGVEPGGERWIETVPRRGYRFVGPVALKQAGATGPTAAIRAPLPLPDKPSIVVLPFQNLSGDTTQDYFVDGLVDDLTVALGREKWLFVIAGPSARVFKDVEAEPAEIAARLGVRYVLRGSFRRVGDQVRVVAQLTDALNGQVFWSERFEDRVDHVFALQDRLAAQVAATIAPALRANEIERAQRKAPQSVTAFDLYLQALPLMRRSLSENRHALELLRKAVALDPEYSAAHALTARCHQFQLIMGWVPRSDPGQQDGIRSAQRAIALGHADSEALWMAGLALIVLDGQVEHGTGLIARSLAHNPNSADAWVSSGMSQSYHGAYAAALQHFEQAQRLNPLDRVHHFRWNLVGNAYFGMRRYDEANDAADQCVSAGPGYPPGLLLKLVVCGQLGHAEAAVDALARLSAVQPGCSLAWMSAYFAPQYRRNPDFVARYVEAARRAGLPERA